MSPPTSTIIIIILLLASRQYYCVSCVFFWWLLSWIVFVFMWTEKSWKTPRTRERRRVAPRLPRDGPVGHCGHTSVCLDGCIRTANDVTAAHNRPSGDCRRRTRHHSPLKPTLWLTARTCSPSDSFEWLRMVVATVCRGAQMHPPGRESAQQRRIRHCANFSRRPTFWVRAQKLLSTAES